MSSIRIITISIGRHLTVLQLIRINPSSRTLWHGRIFPCASSPKPPNPVPHSGITCARGLSLLRATMDVTPLSEWKSSVPSRRRIVRICCCFAYASAGELSSLCSIDDSPEGVPGPSCGSIAERAQHGGGRPVFWACKVGRTSSCEATGGCTN